AGRLPDGAGPGGGAARGHGRATPGLVGGAERVGRLPALRLRRDDLEAAPTGDGPRPGGADMNVRAALLLSLGVVVPGLAVVLAAPLGPGPGAPRPAPVLTPFGWGRLVTVHLLAGLPLGLVCAGPLARALPRDAATFAVAGGLLLSGLTWLGGAALAPALEG